MRHNRNVDSLNATSPSPAVRPEQTSVMGRRVLSFLIDGLLALVVFGATLGQGLTQTTYPTAFTAETRCETILDAGDFCVPIENVAYVAEAEIIGFATFAVAGVWLVNTILLPGLAGWSIGKLLTGVRIVKKKDSTRPSTRQRAETQGDHR